MKYEITDPDQIASLELVFGLNGNQIDDKNLLPERFVRDQGNTFHLRGYEAYLKINSKNGVTENKETRKYTLEITGGDSKRMKSQLEDEIGGQLN